MRGTSRNHNVLKNISWLVRGEGELVLRWARTGNADEGEMEFRPLEREEEKWSGWKPAPYQSFQMVSPPSMGE